MILHRPTGLDELRLVYDSGMRAWPPRLPEQPIFYPVLNFDYAAQIARNWNTKSRSFAGYVTRFEIDDSYAARFEKHVVGGREHEELWVPAEELEEFNGQIVGRIIRVAAYFGPRFRGHVPERGGLAGLDAASQLVRLATLADEDHALFREEIESNHAAVFLHYPYWELRDVTGMDVHEHERVLEKIRAVWSASSPKVPLTVP